MRHIFRVSQFHSIASRTHAVVIVGAIRRVCFNRKLYPSSPGACESGRDWGGEVAYSCAARLSRSTTDHASPARAAGRVTPRHFMGTTKTKLQKQEQKNDALVQTLRQAGEPLVFFDVSLVSIRSCLVFYLFSFCISCTGPFIS